MRLFLIAGLLLCASCQPELENKSEVFYFDMKALLTQQIKRLADLPIKVQKFIRHDKQRENNIIQVANWQQELKIFEEANLNRPIYKDAYAIKDSTFQDTKFRTFVAKNKTLQVRFLRLAYQANTLKSIDANLLIENVLYRSEKDLRLSFQPDSTLKGYQIKGKFGVIYGVNYDYEIDAIVRKK